MMDKEAMEQMIEGHLGRNWKDEYEGIDKLNDEDYLIALDAIIAELE